MKKWFDIIFPLREKIQSLFSNKKILILIGGCTAGFLLLAALLVISIEMSHNQDEMREASEEIQQFFSPQAITSEDIFLPDEPDFIPEVMLDREPKSSWTDEDAEPFWNDALEENADAWRARIIRAVDDILETVP